MLAPKQVPVQANAEILKVQLDTQAKYIAALNELEMLKVQKEIADTKQAITAATLATATAEKNITDLLTVQQLPNAIANAYSPTPTLSTEISPTNTGGSVIPQVPKPVQKLQQQQESPFTLMSVAYKADRWTAVLTAQNKFYNVIVGQTLPIDESVVVEIDRSGVTVMLKDKQTRRITMIPEL
jgi:phage-related tail fiber protein